VRVVSLVPSATETLVALGVTPVGCTRFCDLEGVPTVGGTKNVDVGAVDALAPDLVVVNDEENRIEDASALTERGIALHSMSPRSVADVGPAVDALAAAVGAVTPEVFRAWDAWLARTARPVDRRAFVAIWRRPYMSLASDTYGSSLLAHIGIANVFAESGERYPEVALGAIAALGPDLAVLPDEPYAFGDRHVPEVQAALPNARVVLVDGRDLFWWGIRTSDARARLAQIL
jgi:ABC-type Fe3+-hydroxamate transport system substrate-binding protein